MGPINHRTSAMKTFPLPALISALAAGVALPFDLAAAGTLLLTAGLGFIIHADYALRCRRLRLPRLAASRRPARFRPVLGREPHQLAA
jgi:hypothetical protein